MFTIKVSDNDWQKTLKMKPQHFGKKMQQINQKQSVPMGPVLDITISVLFSYKRQKYGFKYFIGRSGELTAGQTVVVL